MLSQDGLIVRQPSGTFGCPDVAAGEAKADPSGFRIAAEASCKLSHKFESS